tara:strand:+ start:243 stop:410 length:168 start_codon:yes stop_codon:yes gene_type:complete
MEYETCVEEALKLLAEPDEEEALATLKVNGEDISNILQKDLVSERLNTFEGQIFQ